MVNGQTAPPSTFMSKSTCQYERASSNCQPSRRPSRSARSPMVQARFLRASDRRVSSTMHFPYCRHCQHASWSYLAVGTDPGITPAMNFRPCPCPATLGTLLDDANDAKDAADSNGHGTLLDDAALILVDVEW